jgi:hypothetical protein
MQAHKGLRRTHCDVQPHQTAANAKAPRKTDPDDKPTVAQCPSPRPGKPQAVVQKEVATMADVRELQAYIDQKIANFVTKAQTQSLVQEIRDDVTQNNRLVKTKIADLENTIAMDIDARFEELRRSQQELEARFESQLGTYFRQTQNHVQDHTRVISRRIQSVWEALEGVVHAGSTVRKPKDNASDLLPIPDPALALRMEQLEMMAEQEKKELDALKAEVKQGHAEIGVLKLEQKHNLVELSALRTDVEQKHKVQDRMKSEIAQTHHVLDALQADVNQHQIQLRSMRTASEKKSRDNESCRKTRDVPRVIVSQVNSDGSSQSVASSSSSTQ